MSVTFKNQPGYIVVASNCVDCDNAVNGHVIDILVDQDVNGKRYWSRMSQSTICQEKLKADKIQGKDILTEPYLRTESRDFRNALAELQNGDNEICGVCVSHFYADYLDEED